MTNFVHVNFFDTTITAAITSSSTSISLGSTTGAPTIQSGYNWPLVLEANGVYEIVYATAISGSTITVARAQEGTAAQSWASGTTIYDAFTAASVLYVGDTIPFTAITGQIANAQVPESAVTQYQGDLSIAFTQLTGSADDAQVPESAVTQYQGDLSIAFTQLTGSADDAQVPESAVTQYQGDLSIAFSQVTGTISNSQLLASPTFSGTVTAAAFNSTSDARLKKNVRPIDAPLERLARMRGVLFEWKKDGARSAGVIAQDVREALDVAVRGDDILRVDPVAIIGLLVESLNAERAAREALELRVAAIEARAGGDALGTDAR